MKNISKSQFKDLVIDFKKVQICKGRMGHKEESNALEEEKRTSEGFKLEELFLNWVGLDATIVSSNDIGEAIKLTNQALENNEPHIWQASVSANGLFCAVDLLTKSKNKEGAYDIIEIKSCGTPKSEQVVDAAFQKIALEAAGIEIDRVVIVSINTDYVRMGDIEPSKLFRITTLQDEHGNSEIAEKLAAEFKKCQPLIHKAIEEIQKEEVKLKKSSKCLKCPAFKDCFGMELPEYHVGQIYKTGKKADDMIKNNMIDLKDKDVEITSDMTDNQKVYYQAIKKDIEIFDKSKVQSFLNNMTYPIIYLDYETIASAIPMFDKSKPFQPVPTQYTLQIEHEDGTYEKYNYIYEGNGDPREDLKKNLMKDMPETGSVIVWSAHFEKGVNRDLAEFFGDKDFFNDVNDRVIDLMEVFSKRFYYIKEFMASASIKKVIKGLFPEESYGELDIQEGLSASILYEKILFGEITGEKARKIKDDLVVYCDADGFNMKKIKDFLVEKCEA